jgi:adenine deaminase
MNRNKLISVARGNEPADTVLANARIINTLNGEVEEGDVAVYDGMIAGVGEYRQAAEVIDLKGRYLAPGLINGHTHLESSMLDVGQYARAVVPHGTTALITDLHEIANVAGITGIKYVLDYARRLPFDLFLMAPSCVPATHLETSGAAIGPGDIRRMLRWRECIGLGEMMNYPGVLFGDNDVLDIIEAVGDRVIDGHAPGVSGRDLNAYIAAGMRSDHESVELDEAVEKLKRGMYVMIREGSTEKNLEALLPLVTNKTYSRCLFVVDDRNCADILHDGDIDAVVRKAIRLGLEPVRAVQMATINTANYFRLNGLGAIAPGYYANFIVLNDLREFTIDGVFYRGCLVAEEGKAKFTLHKPKGDRLTHTVNVKPFTIDALKLKASGENQPVVEVVPGQIITRKRYEKLALKDGFVQTDTGRDILKAAVVERHHASGNIGLGMVSGFGLKRGAIASSTAHDSHNIVAVGTCDEDIFTAIKEVERLQGGLVLAADGNVVDNVATPIAGLLSDEPLEDVVNSLRRLEKAAGNLGTTLPSPFAVLSFLALPVIPELRLTDLGLVDVNEFKLIQ